MLIVPLERVEEQETEQPAAHEADGPEAGEKSVRAEK
jgi:hypothetical protein